MKPKFANTALATDAMGDNGEDAGGYGIVARQIDISLIHNILEAGGSPGFTVARLSGDMSGTKFPARNLGATKPFSRLNDSWFESGDWIPISTGRWTFYDNIALGESRSVNKALCVISTFKESRDHKLISLQDNRPVSGASAKGRSSSFPLNRSLRRRAALLLACSIRLMMPWVESSRQPADGLSREVC